MSYITVKDLVAGYDGQAVTGKINFTVNKGDYICIVGDNGAGKSTLLKTLLRLIKPISGTIETGDGLSPDEIGYLPQATQIQRDFPASVWEIVLTGTQKSGSLRPFYTKAQKELAHSNLLKMGMCDLMHKSYKNLSGGQQQRILLARALCATDKLLVLDEPVTGLDPKAISDFYQLLSDLNKEGITIIMISHDVATALTFASHVLHVDKDNSFFGTTEEYMAR